MNGDKFTTPKRSANEYGSVAPTRIEILRVLNRILEQREVDGQGDVTTVSNLITQALDGIYDKTLQSEWERKVKVATTKGKKSFVFEFGGKLYFTDNWDDIVLPHAPEQSWTQPKEIEKL